MTHEDLVAYCLAKPGAWEDEPWDGILVAKVRAKIFAFRAIPDDEILEAVDGSYDLVVSRLPRKHRPQHG